MRQAQTPYRTRRGGEGGHGVAKLDPVIHRYVFYLRDTADPLLVVVSTYTIKDLILVTRRDKDAIGRIRQAERLQRRTLERDIFLTEWKMAW